MKGKKSVCMFCGQPSAKRICTGCSAKVQGEVLHKKKKEGKPH